MTTTAMTKAERLELAKNLRLRARVAKSEVDATAASRLADVEAQLAAIYPENDPRWADVAAMARKAVADADRMIAQRCGELGISARFRPALSCGWYGRGENASASRRAELRKVAQTRIEADAKNAKASIDRHEAKLQTALLATGLESADAVAFLNSLPGVDELLPPLQVAALEKMIAPPRDLADESAR